MSLPLQPRAGYRQWPTLGWQAREEPPARQEGAAGWPRMTHGTGGFWGVVGHLAAVEGVMPEDRWGLGLFVLAERRR